MISVKLRLVTFRGTRAEWNHLAHHFAAAGEKRLAKTIEDGVARYTRKWITGTYGIVKPEPDDIIALRFAGGSAIKVEDSLTTFNRIWQYRQQDGADDHTLATRNAYRALDAEYPSTPIAYLEDAKGPFAVVIEDEGP